MARIFLVLTFFRIFSFVSARLKGEGIVGGDYAIDGQFIYQVSIQIDPNEHWCGGGILDERHVLTAGHCVVNDAGYFWPFDFKVVVNSTDLNIHDKGQTIDVESMYVLKSYQPPSRANDIAVLKLKNDIGLNHGLRKLKLPRTNKTYVGQLAKIAGYGWNSVPVYVDSHTGRKYEGTGVSDNKLKYLNVNIISTEECRKKNKDQVIFDSSICGQAVQRHINGQLEGVCTGDSGGPLVIIDTVIGVVSTSPTGCEESVEAAPYTRVSSFVKFIDNVMKNVNSDDIRTKKMSISRGHRHGSKPRSRFSRG